VALALTACQVHQLQLALNQGIRLRSVELVHCERQNAVGPRRLVVHQMSCLDLVFLALVKLPQTLVRSVNCEDVDIFNTCFVSLHVVLQFQTLVLPWV
jgi:hypothetical protein